MKKSLGTPKTCMCGSEPDMIMRWCPSTITIRCPKCGLKLSANGCDERNIKHVIDVWNFGVAKRNEKKSNRRGN